MKKTLLIGLASFAVAMSLHAQTKVMDTFYGTRVINLHTTQQVGKKVLAYRISHRFGTMESDVLYQFFGLDGGANTSMQFDYGISDKLGIGIARDGLLKVYSGYVKYSLLSESHGGGSPVGLVLYGKGNILTIRDGAAAANGFDRYDNFAHRLSSVVQLIVSRKLGERFAIQLAPTYIHHNLVETNEESNDIFAVSAAAQFKLTKRLGLSAEYSYALNKPDGNFNSAGIGLDIVTGGHIFQIHVINSQAINEAWALPYTNTEWPEGGFRLGFNISRSFWL